jgi:hypothetical protein
LKLTLNSDYAAKLDQDGNFTQSQKLAGNAQYSAQTDNKIVAANLKLVLQGKIDNMPVSENTSVIWGTEYDVNLTITAIHTDIVDVRGAAGFSGMFGEDTTWEDLSPNPYITATSEFSPFTVLFLQMKPKFQAKWQDSTHTVESTLNFEISIAKKIIPP